MNGNVIIYLVTMIEDTTFEHMRRKGTKYDTIGIDELKQLTQEPVQVGVYADQNDIKNMNYVYIMYDRYLAGKGSNPGYTIRSWNGTNVVIPN